MKKQISLAIIIIAIIICTSTISTAGVEIKEGTDAYTSVNVSESFEICYNLRNGDSTLGTSNLDPHLATSLDWGAVAYLAQSRYGTNSTRLNDFNNTTTGNNSGVRELDGYTQIATMFENRNTTSSNAQNYRYALEQALQDESKKKYVDLIPSYNELSISTTLGRAMEETKNWYGANYSMSSNTDNPMIIRNSLFGVFGNIYNTGEASDQVTFRPVIWN